LADPSFRITGIPAHDSSDLSISFFTIKLCHLALAKSLHRLYFMMSVRGIQSIKIWFQDFYFLVVDNQTTKRYVNHESCNNLLFCEAQTQTEGCCSWEVMPRSKVTGSIPRHISNFSTLDCKKKSTRHTQSGYYKSAVTIDTIAGLL